MRTEFDVIVVGGGGSGLAAAVSAAEHGADVLLLEKQPQLGGTTGIAVGSFTANRTRLQRKQGIHDDLEGHCADAGSFASPEIETRNNERLRRFFLSHSAETLDWLMDMGLVFHGPSPEPPNRVPRMHNVVPGAKAYVATLQARLLKLDGTIRVNAPVVRFVHDQVDHGIVGVVALMDDRETELRARRGIVLAAGDYANDRETIARFKGERYSAIEGINPYATGDGQRLAEQAGAKLLNMDLTYGPELRFVTPKRHSFQQLLPTKGRRARVLGRLLPVVPRFVLNAMIRRLLVTWQHPENALFDDGAILINHCGERFCDETVWPDREIAVASQRMKEAFILLDQRLADRYSGWPHFVSTAPKTAYAYVRDYLRLRPDVAIEAPTLSALANRRQIPPENLIATVEAWNATAESRSLEKLGGNRWVLLGPLKAWFTTTEGGTAIDEQFRVLNDRGEPIPGLFAVGQNGLGGQVLWGHGLHIAWALTSGRLVGKLFTNPAALDAEQARATDSGFDA